MHTFIIQHDKYELKNCVLLLIDATVYLILRRRRGFHLQISPGIFFESQNHPKLPLMGSGEAI